MTRIQPPFATLAVILTALLAGCTSDVVNERSDSPQPKAERDAAPTPEWSAGIIDRTQSDAPVSKLVAVRTATHDGFDQVVFEFDKRIPGYHIEYIDSPVRQCGSGKVAPIAGDGWLEIRMYPSNAHTSEGRPTITERERILNLPVLSELELTCDFEAVVTWVLGVESPNRYRVRELSGPPRLVIDIRH